MRLQLPFVVAGAATWNAIQGVTLRYVVLDASLPPFAHGSLYQVLGRVRAKSGVRVVIPRVREIMDNVVWPEFLDLEEYALEDSDDGAEAAAGGVEVWEDPLEPWEDSLEPWEDSLEPWSEPLEAWEDEEAATQEGDGEGGVYAPTALAADRPAKRRKM